MKAVPMILGAGGYDRCEPSDATHLKLNFPGPQGTLIIPVMIGGTRDGTPNWTWNGDVEKPTLKPSIKTHGCDYLCHSFVNDGLVTFLEDCSHDLKGQTLEMLDV
jgi:hypothetical protein